MTLPFLIKDWSTLKMGDEVYLLHDLNDVVNDVYFVGRDCSKFKRDSKFYVHGIEISGSYDPFNVLICIVPNPLYGGEINSNWVKHTSLATGIKLSEKDLNMVI